MIEKVIIPARINHPSRKYFKAARISTADVSRYLGISYNTTWQILVGDRPPTLRQEVLLAKLVKAIQTGTVEREGEAAHE